MSIALTSFYFEDQDCRNVSSCQAQEVVANIVDIENVLNAGNRKDTVISKQIVLYSFANYL